MEISEQAETIQATALLRSVRILRKVLETWENLMSLRLQWKNINFRRCKTTSQNDKEKNKSSSELYCSSGKQKLDKELSLASGLKKKVVEHENKSYTNHNLRLWNNIKSNGVKWKSEGELRLSRAQFCWDPLKYLEEL